MSTLWAFLKLSRPHFLVGGAVMYGLGASLAPAIDFGPYLLGQALVTSAQVTAHYVNEYADVGADRLVANRTMFSGGSGVLVAGALSPTVALRAAQLSSVTTAVLAALVVTVSPAAAVLGLAALAVSWAYSMPPVRLLDTGWGELATSTVVVGLVPAIGALANGGTIDAELLWAVAMLLPVHMTMMLAFELPDLETDRAAAKTVLAVRIGPNTTNRLMVALLASAFGVGAAAAFTAGVDVSWLPLTAVIPAVITVIAAHRGAHAVSTAAAVATLMTLGVALIL